MGRWYEEKCSPLWVKQERKVGHTWLQTKAGYSSLVHRASLFEDLLPFGAYFELFGHIIDEMFHVWIVKAQTKKKKNRILLKGGQNTRMEKRLWLFRLLFNSACNRFRYGLRGGKREIRSKKACIAILGRYTYSDGKSCELCCGHCIMTMVEVGEEKTNELAQIIGDMFWFNYAGEARVDQVLNGNKLRAHAYS